MNTIQKELNTENNTAGTPVEVRRSPWKGLALTFAGLAAVLLATTVWGWQAKPTGDAYIKLTLGFIALFGTLLTAVVALIGFLLKDSLDRRTLGLQLEAENRRADEAAQAEARLRMDTSLTAVELMGANGEEGGTPLQRAGALMALANLGHMAFALGLLDELWEGGLVPSTSAVWLIEKCLVSEDGDLEEAAADLLRKHSDRLLLPEGRFLWPDAAFDEKTIELLSPLAVFWSLEALLGCLISRNCDEWDWEYLNEAHVLLDLFQGHDDTRRSAAHAMKTLMGYFLPRVGDNLNRKRYEESSEEAEQIIAGGSASDSEAGRMPFLLDRLQTWLSEASDEGD